MAILLLIAVLFVGFFGYIGYTVWHCRKVGSTFKDFYFGNKSYDIALRKYKEKKNGTINGQ
jgi:hypothetical protein